MAKRGKINNQNPTEDTDERPFRPRRYAYFILIVCEDQKTEPYYFKQIKKLFPEETVYVKEIGTGKKPKGIVEQSIKERNDFYEKTKKEVNEVWVVFDKDDEGNNAKTLVNFNAAWKLAQDEKINIAFSNEVFELWLLLHFEDVDLTPAIPRADIYSRLETSIKNHPDHREFTYEHGDTSIIDIIATIGNEEEAIKRAEILLSGHNEVNRRPIESNPSTMAHLLVKQLRDLIQWHSNIP